MYAGYATYYPSDLLLDFFTYGGAPNTNNLGFTGSGVGAVYNMGSGFKLSGNYVAKTGADSSYWHRHRRELSPPLPGSCSTKAKPSTATSSLRLATPMTWV